MYEDEFIDLRVYLDVLLRRRRMIVVVTLVAALTAFVVSAALPPTYEAKAALSVGSRRSNITLTEDFVLSEEETLLDLKRQEDALTEIAQSLTVAEMVAQAQPELLEEEQSSNVLVKAIEVQTKGDLLLLTASAGDPQRAATLANAWMEAMSTQIDMVYALSPETVAEIESQRDISRQEYAEAQSKLEVFLEASPLADLQSQVQVAQVSLDKYEASLAQSAASRYTKQIDEQKKRLTALYAEESQIRQQLLNAQSLVRQLSERADSGADSWGLALAFINLQAGAYGGVPAGLLQLDLSGSAPDVQSTEVAELVATLQNKQAEIQQESATLAEQLGDVQPVESVTTESVVEQQVEYLIGEVASLESQIERQAAQKNELTAARDVAWTTYKSLLDKLHELQVENAVSTSEARVAFEALPPTNPTAPRKLMNTALAGVVGLMLAVGTVFVMEYLAPPERAKEESPEVKGLAGWLMAEASGLSYLKIDGNGNGRGQHDEVIVQGEERVVPSG
ncbi:MAG: Wzz/FepE/Etk N-terminal domain-containing protein [Chloroflexota bacterium]|nr:Wzz/FepE/Etk N-terminal domain-containing protein [Chloroflexota bacterium]